MTAPWYGVKSDHRATLIKIKIAKFLKKNPTSEMKKPVRRDFDALNRDVGTLADFHREALDILDAKGTEAERGEHGKRLSNLQESLMGAALKTLPPKRRKIAEWFQRSLNRLLPKIEKRNRTQATYARCKGHRQKQAKKKAQRELKSEIKKSKELWLSNMFSLINNGWNTRQHSQRDIWKLIKTVETGTNTIKKETIMKLAMVNGDLTSNYVELKQTLNSYMSKVFSNEGVYDQSVLNKIPLRPEQRCLNQKPTQDEIKKAISTRANNKAPGEDGCPAELYKAMLENPALSKEFNLVLEELWTSGSLYDEADEGLPQLEVLDLSDLSKLPAEDCVIKFQQNNPYIHLRSKAYDTYKQCTTVKSALEIENISKEQLQEDLKNGYMKVPPFLPGLPRTNFIELQCDDGGGLMYAQWLKSRLILLPKKGDLTDPKNWRPICLLDVASKILSSIMVTRMQVVYERIGRDEQCGFRPARGTIDAMFNVLMALQKRKQFKLDTYVVFVDLVKAFDSISREALFEILRRYGIPDHFLSVLIRLHKGSKFVIDINGEDKLEVDSKIGVRQGSCEGPVLFSFFMLAVMETLECSQTSILIR